MAVKTPITRERFVEARSKCAKRLTQGGPLYEIVDALREFTNETDARFGVGEMGFGYTMIFGPSSLSTVYESECGLVSDLGAAGLLGPEENLEHAREIAHKRFISALRDNHFEVWANAIESGDYSRLVDMLPKGLQ
jgi:hypothetical protein